MSAPDVGTRVRLAEYTTTRVGGPATTWIEATSAGQAIEAIREADAAGTALLVLGGGSNTLAADEGFPGTVVHLAFEGLEVMPDPGDRATPGTGTAEAGTAERGAHESVLVRMAAGQPWDAAVAATVEQGLSGLEALSGIPGSAGATPVQNVGAYGADISQRLVSLTAWDRHEGRIVEMTNAQLQFGYRDSVIKRTLSSGATDPARATPRWVVLSVDFRLTRSGTAAPIRYGQLAKALGVHEGHTGSLAAVREAVLELRAGKGMVLDGHDHDTWSTGSFFTNPVVPASVRARLPEGAPAFAAGEDADGEPLVKLSAAWLIDHAGFGKGFGLPDGPASGHGPDTSGLAGGRAALSTKHTLAVTNRGGAGTEDLLTIARAVRDGVENTFGIRLHPEPVLVGCGL